MGNDDREFIDCGCSAEINLYEIYGPVPQAKRIKSRLPAIDEPRKHIVYVRFRQCTFSIMIEEEANYS